MVSPIHRMPKRLMTAISRYGDKLGMNVKIPEEKKFTLLHLAKDLEQNLDAKPTNKNERLFKKI